MAELEAENKTTAIQISPAKKIQNISAEVDHLTELLKDASKSLRKLKSEIRVFNPIV